jgi:hypothetical protein
MEYRIYKQIPTLVDDREATVLQNIGGHVQVGFRFRVFNTMQIAVRWYSVGIRYGLILPSISHFVDGAFAVNYPAG